MIEEQDSHFDINEDQPDTKPSSFEACSRTELIELLKNREIRRQYIMEFTKGDFEKLMGWIETTNKRKSK